MAYQQQQQQQHQPQQHQQQRSFQDDDSEGKLFVGGLAWESTEETIKQYFDQFGLVESVNLKRSKEDPSKHRGFCFVKFASQESADSVLKQGSPHMLDGSKIDPKSACPAGVRPEQRTKKIFVGGLQEQTTEERLMEYFSQFGQVQNKIEFAVDRTTGKKRGFCFVEFASEGIVDRIVKMQYHDIAGKRLETKRALSKQQQAEEAARQSTQVGYGGGQHHAAVAALPPQILQAATSAGGAYIQPAGVSPYAQPVIYIHPDSLSTSYPSTAVGLQTSTAYPQQLATSGYETLYQPYAKTVGARPAGGASAVTSQTQRHMPYTSRKY